MGAPGADRLGVFGHKKRNARDASDRATVSDWLTQVTSDLDDREAAEAVSCDRQPSTTAAAPIV